MQEAYGRLKEEVAAAIRKGDKGQALKRIQRYERHNAAINAKVGSEMVKGNLEKDVRQLRDTVEDTFAGAPAAVAEKQKVRAKALQYDSYESRRAK